MKILLASLAWVATAAAAQEIYQTPPNMADWTVISDPTQCVLEQPIDGYGIAKFIQEAGRAPVFQIDAFRPVHRNQQAELVARPGHWRPGQSGRFLRALETRAVRPNLVAQGEVVQDSINTLLDGWQVVLIQSALEVRLQPSRFTAAYRQWVNCLGGLLPMNFADISRNTLYYEKGQIRLLEKDREVLSRIAAYVRADDAVTGVYIDGHTDDGGGFLENEDISRLRSEQVGRFFESEGVDPRKLIIRYHGEYYPVASNLSPEGRAQNRRVTLRLERNGLTADERDESGLFDRRVNNAPPRLPTSIE